MPWMTIGPNAEYETYVDDEDVHFLEERYWFFGGKGVKYRKHGKRRGNGERDPSTVSYLHREIMKATKDQVVDHIDGNALNNSRSNLRLCTVGENNHNRDPVGVWQKGNKWYSQIGYEGVRHWIGSFNTFEEARAAYVAKSKELRGEFHREDMV